MTPSEQGPRPLPPLKLPPDSPVIELVDRREIGEVHVNTEWKGVHLGASGIEAIRQWLARYQQKPSDGELELWTQSGIAQECDVTVRTAQSWVRLEGFPPPFATPVGGGPVWLAASVRTWLVTSRPRVGRQAKAIRP